MASPQIARLVFTVAPCEGGWTVEKDGLQTNRLANKEEALACAARLARAQQDQGQACRVIVTGDIGYF